MCGIVGIINLDQSNICIKTLKSMMDAIQHRGPDGQGQWIEENIGIGHRRLAVIDLNKRANQPLIDRNNRYVLSYNGEIYNFRELRNELSEYGYIFTTSSDSEVVLYSLVHWGHAALRKFNGMFAIAFWDRISRELLLARDRYGIKPLYYYQSNDIFLFASEVKAFYGVKKFNKQTDPEGLYEYFTFQNFFTDRTLLKNVKLVPAGSYLTFNPNCSDRPRLTQYWDFKFDEPSRIRKINDYKYELDYLFRRSVRRQLVSDVDVGCFLSGGIDSGAVAAVATSYNEKLRTFTCGFDMSSVSGIERNFDEREQSRKLAEFLNTEHHEVVLKSGDMERILSKLVWHLDEPRVGQCYPNYYACMLASNYNKVVLTGTGGDEIFGGYPWRYYRNAKNQSFDQFIDQYYFYWQRLIPNNMLRRVFAPIKEEVKNVWTRDIFKGVYRDHASRLTQPQDYVNHCLYLEAKTFLHGLLVIEDKLAMAHSLEARFPFLDNDLVDFAMKLPVSMKLAGLDKIIAQNENDIGRKTENYYLKNNDGKILLRKVMQSYLPKEVTERSKQGFSGPDASWFRDQSLDFIKSVVFNNNSLIYQFMDPNPVRELVMDHLDGRENRRLLIWSLLNIEQTLINHER